MTDLAGGDALVAASTALALAITKVVDFVRTAFDKADNPKFKPYWSLAALALGMLGAVFLDINVFADASGPLDGFAGELLTGAGMGATGSAWHEILDAVSSSAKRSKATAAEAAEN